MLTSAPKSEAALLVELTPIFRQVLDNDGLQIAADMTAKDVEGWNSLNHTSLIVAIEQHFRIKFKLRDVVKFKNIGDMCRAIFAAMP